MIKENIAFLSPEVNNALQKKFGYISKNCLTGILNESYKEGIDFIFKKYINIKRQFKGQNELKDISIENNVLYIFKETENPEEDIINKLKAHKTTQNLIKEAIFGYQIKSCINWKYLLLSNDDIELKAERISDYTGVDKNSIKKKIKKKILLAHGHLDFLRKGKSKDLKHFSNTQLKIMENQQIKNKEWMENTYIKNLETGDLICSVYDAKEASRKQILSEAYAISLGMQEIAEKMNFKFSILTLTLKGYLHPKPSKGKLNYRGYSPEFCKQQLAKEWNTINSLFKAKSVKFFGFRVFEPHKDGAPHLHAMVLSNDQGLIETQIEKRNMKNKNNSSCHIGNIDFTAWKTREGGSTIASYLTKYLMKNADEDLETKAWKSGFSMRQLSYFGFKKGFVSKWRSVYSYNPETAYCVTAERLKNLMNNKAWGEVLLKIGFEESLVAVHESIVSGSGKEYKKIICFSDETGHTEIKFKRGLVSLENQNSDTKSLD